MKTDSNLERASICFSVKDKVGALEDVLSMLSKLNISLTRIESRPSRTKGDYDFFVDFVANPESVAKAFDHVKLKTNDIRWINSGDSDAGVGTTPWFPRKISDLDTFAEKVLSYGADLDADHPGFKDLVYRERRASITKAALEHKHGEKLPLVDYSQSEIETWGVVYRKLRELYKTHACAEHNYIFPVFQY
jgi:phenylalanine-4-hydroxylase